MSSKEKNMATKKTVAIPKVEFKIEPLASTFRVSDGEFFGEQFDFEISSDGTVTINDNTFDSRDQAAKVLRQMADFLAKK
jgi:hypothetical protein